MKIIHTNEPYRKLLADYRNLFDDMQLDTLWYAQRMDLAIHQPEVLATMEKTEAVVVADIPTLQASTEAEVRTLIATYQWLEANRLPQPEDLKK